MDFQNLFFVNIIKIIYSSTLGLNVPLHMLRLTPWMPAKPSTLLVESSRVMQLMDWGVQEDDTARCVQQAYRAASMLAVAILLHPGTGA